MRLSNLMTVILLLLASAGVHADTERRGPSGLVLPRFVALDTDEAYMRSGPGFQYPILWVYRRDGLPLKVLEEHEEWRQVEDHDGTVGWMHRTLLTNDRTVMIIGAERRMYKKPDPTSRHIVTTEPGVIAALKRCSRGWCEVHIAGLNAWIQRVYLWGLLEEETI